MTTRSTPYRPVSCSPMKARVARLANGKGSKADLAAVSGKNEKAQSERREQLRGSSETGRSGAI